MCTPGENIKEIINQQIIARLPGIPQKALGLVAVTDNIPRIGR